MTRCHLGVLTMASCVPKACDVDLSQNPYTYANACGSSLSHGTGCTPECHAGYTLNGSYSCHEGSLTKGHCVPNACNASMAPENGGVGNCTARMEHGEECLPTCNPGYSISGCSHCWLGVMDTPRCLPNGCGQPAAPVNGGVGSCTSELMHGESCVPTCMTGYSLFGWTSCSFGQLSVARCEPAGDAHQVL